MGTQITIERKALEDAGWAISTHVDPAVWDDDEQFIVFPETTHMVISKGDYVFTSYVSDAFCADCNNWGQNKAIFTEAGLLDLPHVLA